MTLICSVISQNQILMEKDDIGYLLKLHFSINQYQT